jgi:hypothetical protein
MIQQFYAWGEAEKRSLDWLIKRLINVKRRFYFMSGGDRSMWTRLFPWLTITARCWLGVHRRKSTRHLFTDGEVRPESNKKYCFPDKNYDRIMAHIQLT